MKITTEMTIPEVLALDAKAATLLAESGMNCLGCSTSSDETLEEAAIAHGLDPVLLVRKLNFRLFGEI